MSNTSRTLDELLDRLTATVRERMKTLPHGPPRCPEHGAALPCQLCELAMEARRLTGCGVPPNMLGCTLDNFQVSSKLEGAAVAKCRKYVQERKGGLMIVGSDVGIGKTHLAIGVIRQWRQPLFITHAEMVRELREAYSSKGEPMRRMQSCELLCIDDLGIALHGRDEPSMWYEVLAWRHGHNLPFVLTSNLGPTELGAILDARLADRLRECSLVIKLAGKSKRRARE